MNSSQKSRTRSTQRSTDKYYSRPAKKWGDLKRKDLCYGIYIKKVNGIRADYNLDGAYWNLTKNGEYLMTGADMTPIADGEHYEFTYTKG